MRAPTAEHAPPRAAVSYTHLRAHETPEHIVCRLLLEKQNINNKISLPTNIFPTKKEDITKCPVCLLNISKGLEAFRKSERGTTWQPAWRSSKKEEGDDSSIQIMHVNPLVEMQIKHNSSNVRYGHRWCNVSMTDHSLDETLDFMEFVVRAHNRCK